MAPFFLFASYQHPKKKKTADLTGILIVCLVDLCRFFLFESNFVFKKKK